MVERDLLAPLVEINALIDSHGDFAHVLDKIVGIVQPMLKSDVSSIYLYHTQRERLILEATRGLAKESVGRVSLRAGHGLVGKCFAQLEPILSSNVFQEADFAYLPETKEEQFHSLLAVPILYQHQPLGVLTIQHTSNRSYKPYEVHFLQLIAGQLAPLISRARFQTQVERTLESNEASAPATQNDVHKGRGASPGIAWGVPFIPKNTFEDVSTIVLSESKDAQIVRFNKAVLGLVGEIKAAKASAATHLNANELAIFDAYDMILAHDTFQSQVIDKINAGRSCPQAIGDVMEEITDPLLESDDLYLRERAFDIQDIGKRLISRLVEGNSEQPGLLSPTEPHILVTHTLPIFDLIRLCGPETRGIVCEEGGTTGHAAILAQSMGIPAVMGVKGLTRRLRDGDLILMDGNSGIVITNPDTTTFTLYKDKKKALKSLLEEVDSGGVPEKITDPYPIDIVSNVGSLDQMGFVRTVGADGVGLYRTEFPFLIRRTLPNEEEQFTLYKQVLETAGSLPVTFRILDVGGDKPLSALSHNPEENPSLGWRAIRLVLARPEIFEMQLRALLRASAFGNMKLLFPMVSTLDEVTVIKEHLANVRLHLKRRKCAFARKIPFGIMIEVPSAVALAEELVQEVDFVSIGTNDLIQYTLAVDRNNPEVSDFYDPYHPAIVRAIAHVAHVARAHDRPVSICGEMASDANFLAFFLALKVSSLSVSPIYIPEIKRRLLSKTWSPIDLDWVLKARTSSAVREALGVA